MIHRHPDFQGVNPKNKTALHVAVGTGSLHTTIWLVQHGARVNAHFRDDGPMPLDCSKSAAISAFLRSAFVASLFSAWVSVHQ